MKTRRGSIEENKNFLLGAMPYRKLRHRVASAKSGRIEAQKALSAVEFGE